MFRKELEEKLLNDKEQTISYKAIRAIQAAKMRITFPARLTSEVRNKLRESHREPNKNEYKKLLLAVSNIQTWVVIVISITIT